MIPKGEAHSHVGQGWHPLVRSLVARLDQMNSDYEITKVHSHNGSLRFYATGLTETQTKLVREVESRSLTLCEICGGPGRLSVVNNGRHNVVRTACVTHYYNAMAEWGFAS